MDHPLRAIRKIVNAALTALSPEFEKLYARSGRPSIAPEKLTPSGEGPTVRIRFAPARSPLRNLMPMISAQPAEVADPPPKTLSPL